MRLFGKIGRKLLGWFLLVALIPLLFMGYQGYYFARRAVEQEVYRHMETVARSKQLAIEQWFSERHLDLAVLSANPVLASGALDTAAVRSLLRSVQSRSTEYAIISVTNRRGQTVAVPSNEPILIPPPTDATRNNPHAPMNWEGDVYLHPKFGPSINLPINVKDDSGRVLVSGVATLPLTNTLNPIILDTTGLGSSGQAYLVNKYKVMLTPSRFMNHPAPLSHTMDTEGIRRALSGRSGAGVYKGYQGHGAHGEFEGQQVLGAWAYLPQQEWALIAEMNADEAFSPLATLRRDAIFVALITMGAILIVVALISRSISLPIRQLAEASLDVSRGNLDRTVTVRLSDEIGELGERFNKMVTSLRDSQRQLVQSERLAAIGELVASVVHEIRNPLSAIKMNLRILESKCTTLGSRSADDPIVAEHFNLARTQTDRLESMLTELLDYSKPIALNKQPVSAADLIEDTLSHFRSELPAGVSLVTRIQPDLPPLNADSERLAQVLLNLLLNARQAVGDHGAITISANKTPDAIRLSISDDGHGISEENLKHVFEPFFTTRKNGTGLGLPNARKIVEAHGGVITIMSEPEHGTSVNVELPIA